MMRYGVIGAVLVVAACTGQAQAQAVVEDPGYCAQYYPNSNCTNYGPGNPLYSDGFRPSGPAAAYRGPYAAAAPVVVRHRHLHPHYR